jgi:hypothetical protein
VLYRVGEGVAGAATGEPRAMMCPLPLTAPPDGSLQPGGSPRCRPRRDSKITSDTYTSVRVELEVERDKAERAADLVTRRPGVPPNRGR